MECFSTCIADANLRFNVLLYMYYFYVKRDVLFSKIVLYIILLNIYYILLYSFLKILFKKYLEKSFIKFKRRTLENIISLK